jgi:thymidylate synthase
MERLDWLQRNRDGYDEWKYATHDKLDELGVPRRALSLSWNQRSVDVALGLPFNIASYGLLCCMVAHCVGMIPDMLVGFLGDCHIYENQMDGVDELLKRSPYVYHNPKLILNPDVKDLFSFTYDDIKIENYESFPPVEMPLSVG